ncbi:hypothetical protein EYF80_017564 [Liparis tanakae]|uniref:Uncharacterized protein n=1 Tax=Liparis tanakae TaxID=230148 RepID=A0A4Z2I384_9TELE|nr:hypothetical protein EYF80_017564 [Liparis tanakae]
MGPTSPFSPFSPGGHGYSLQDPGPRWDLGDQLDQEDPEHNKKKKEHTGQSMDVDPEVRPARADPQDPGHRHDQRDPERARGAPEGRVYLTGRWDRLSQQNLSHQENPNGYCLLLMDTELAAGESRGGNSAPILNYYIFSDHFPEAHIAQIELHLEDPAHQVGQGVQGGLSLQQDRSLQSVPEGIIQPSKKSKISLGDVLYLGTGFSCWTSGSSTPARALQRENESQGPNTELVILTKGTAVGEPRETTGALSTGEGEIMEMLGGGTKGARVSVGAGSAFGTLRTVLSTGPQHAELPLQHKQTHKFTVMDGNCLHVKMDSLLPGWAWFSLWSLNKDGGEIQGVQQNHEVPANHEDPVKKEKQGFVFDAQDNGESFSEANLPGEGYFIIIITIIIIITHLRTMVSTFTFQSDIAGSSSAGNLSSQSRSRGVTLHTAAAGHRGAESDDEQGGGRSTVIRFRTSVHAVHRFWDNGLRSNGRGLGDIRTDNIVLHSLPGVTQAKKRGGNVEINERQDTDSEKPMSSQEGNTNRDPETDRQGFRERS